MHTPSKRKAGPPDSPKRKKARTAEPERAEFQIVRSSLVLTIPPVFAANCRTGAEEMLDSMIMRYQPALGGVVLAHTNLQFLDRAGRIKAESPFASLNVGFDATVWRPEIGMKLKGNVSLCSPDHISLLVHRTFNVSIPRHHIPAGEWEFEYGAAENDPEFGTVLEGEIEGEGQVESADRGRWIHRVTAEPVGGKRGRVEFTVVGLTIANQMLSLIGSMQLDPFSPDHVPQAARARPAAVRDESEGEREDKDEDESDRSKVETEEVKAEREKREMKRKRNDEKSGKAERKTPKRKKSS